MDEEIVEVCCEFARFTFNSCLKSDNNKWKVILPMGKYLELDDREIFNYFLEKKYGNKD